MKKFLEVLMMVTFALGFAGCSAVEADALMGSAKIYADGGGKHWFMFVEHNGVNWWVNAQMLVEQGYVQAGTDSAQAIGRTIARLQGNGYQVVEWAAVPEVIRQMIMAELMSAPVMLPMPFLILPVAPLMPTPTVSPLA